MTMATIDALGETIVPPAKAETPNPGVTTFCCRDVLLDRPHRSFILRPSKFPEENAHENSCLCLWSAGDGCRLRRVCRHTGHAR